LGEKKKRLCLLLKVFVEKVGFESEVREGVMDDEGRINIRATARK